MKHKKHAQIKEKREAAKLSNGDVEQSTTKESDDETKNLPNEVEQVRKDLADQQEKFLRLAAEYDNYRKRSDRDRLGLFSEAVCGTVSQFLPMLDNIYRALEAYGQDDQSAKPMQLLKVQFDEILAKLGVTPFGQVGDAFDPNLHNAISHTEDEALSQNMVSQVFQKGFRCGDKVVRHAMVAVTN